jgi:hypothetical protein
MMTEYADSIADAAQDAQFAYWRTSMETPIDNTATMLLDHKKRV